MAPSRDSRPPLSGELCTQLWTRILTRLKNGEVLISNRQFQLAFEEEYWSLTGTEPEHGARQQIRRMIEKVNRAYPETYMAHGLRNGVSRAFEEGVRTLEWDVSKIQARGARSIRRFSRQNPVRDLLEEANLRLDQGDVLHCLKQGIARLEQAQERAESAPEVEESPSPPLSSSPPPFSALPASIPAAGKQIRAAIERGEVSDSEVRRRLQRQQQRQSELEGREQHMVPPRLASYVQRGVLSAAEAKKLEQIYQVDEQLEKGEIDQGEHERIINSILEAKVREALEKKIGAEISSVVRYLQVFESMQKIDPNCDRALEYLIRHRYSVTAAPNSRVDLGAALKELMEDGGLFDEVASIMERTDQEIRLLSVRLPPYNYVVKGGVEKIDNMTIEESFVHDLRHLDVDEVSERLNSPEQEVRVRLAADIRCFISLVEHLIKPTRFRKELRLLRISQQIEQFYSVNPNLREARRQAENFLTRRLERIFPDLSTEENQEIEQRSTQMINEIEQRIVDERRREVEEQHKREAAAEATTGRQSPEAGKEDDLELSEEEIQRGVQIGRVEVRIAGRMRRMPRKLMPDPKNSKQYIMVERDRESGELVPVLRRGVKRAVERGRDGFWQEIRGG